MQFTDDQQRVIDARKKNILVSAAAGSGKTAVLVERIIKMVTEGENPPDIDKLLVVTFTSAAAAEMRERILAGINLRLMDNPGSEHLQRQAALVYNAKITTIHSFCLEVIRNYFNEIGLDPAFRIADEGELKLIKKDVMKEMLEDKYDEGDPGFLHFVETYTRGSNDNALEELIEKVYDFILSFPIPESALKKYTEDAKKTGSDEILNSPGMLYLLGYIQNMLKGMEKNLTRALDITQKPDGPYMYAQALESDLLKIEELLKAGNDYQKFSAILSQTKFDTLSRKSDDTVSPEKKETVKAIRNDVKECLKKIQEKFFFADLEEILRCEVKSKKAMSTLFGLVKEYMERVSAAKKDKNIIDFQDMEHYALKLLVKEDNGILYPTKVAEDYRDYFEEVIVDEYQDSNLVQEFILEAVSGEKCGKYNRFMVGDVKQSIYRFRQARPELFMEKYLEYPRKGDKCSLFNLSMNFRSRQEVLSSTNGVFSQIMTDSFGGIVYDNAAALHYGATYYKGQDNYESELLLIEKPGKEDKDDAKEREAYVVAKKIQELVGSLQVYDKNMGTTRRAQYKDMVILLRSNKGWDDIFKKVLTEEMIPCHTESKSGYFDAPEIRNVIEFLKVLDNPIQDIPLFGVMTSVFGGFSDEEMAVIKAGGEDLKGERLYYLVKRYGETQSDDLAEKINVFLNKIDGYRKKSRYVPIRALLWQLFTEHDYIAVVSAMKGGEQRCANVELLLQKASVYEQTSYFGAFHFVRYLQQLMEKEVDYGEADILDEQADVVRIMSIHKSKGLEFPICFVAGLGKKFNFMDTYQVLVTDTQLGVGTECIDYEKRLQSRTLSKNIIVQKMLNDALAEEIRVLYVAFTRAREKLILSACITDPEKNMEGISQYEKEEREPLSVCELSKATRPIQYVLMSLADEKTRQAFSVQCIKSEDMPILRTQTEIMEQYTENTFSSRALEISSGEMVKNINARLDYQYPNQNLAGLYTKTTVSELKKAAYSEEDGAKPMFNAKEDATILPKFLKGEEKIPGTMRGNAYHKVMEVFPFHSYPKETMLTEDMVQEVINKAADNGKIPKEYIHLVQYKKICNFLNSSLGKRMRCAAIEGKVYREQPFVYGIPANRLSEEFPSKETVLIQGIIDAYFEEKESIVLLDYKTDVINEEDALVKRYQIQLNYYAEVLEKLLKKPVSDIMIYSFYLEKEIKLQNNK